MLEVSEINGDLALNAIIPMALDQLTEYHLVVEVQEHLEV